MMRSATVAILVCAAAACGGDDALNLDAAVHADAPHVGDAAKAAPVALVAAPGVLATVDIGTQAVHPVAVASDLLVDPILRHVGSAFELVDRGGSNGVLLLDEASLGVTAQLTFHAAPQDVAVVGDKVYVPELTGSGVEVQSVTGGAAGTGGKVIPLAAGCMSAFAVGSDIYVACAAGAVFVIDSASDTVRAQLQLATPNPASLIEDVGDGTLAIATGDPNTGCIERITPGAVPVANGCIVRNEILGGYATRLQFQPLDTSIFLWMAAAGNPAPNPEELLAYDTTALEAWPPISTPGETIGDVGLCPDGTLVLADTGAATAGLRIYQLATEITVAPIAVGATPSSPHGIVCR